MNNDTNDVDFDFFDTPRNTDRNTPRSPGKYFDRKPPPSPTSNNHGERPASGIHLDIDGSSDKRGNDAHEDSYSDSFSSDTDSETPRVDKGKQPASRSINSVKKSDGGKREKRDYSESSSAYSNSDYSSDDSFEQVNYNNNRKKEKIEVNIPKMQVNAWSMDYTKDVVEEKKVYEHGKNKQSEKGRYNLRRRRSNSNSSESDSSCERKNAKESKNRKDRVKSAKPSRGRQSDNSRKPLRSTSSSFSNNSDITDVSSLESPVNSPRVVRRGQGDTSEKENGQYRDVQYRDPEKDVNIKLESDQIDLSILMKCMADIDQEKQQRLKANTRRVMFAPPTAQEKGIQNYSFSMGRAKLIENENQRLLKQIMQHVGTGTGKQKSLGKPKKYVHQEPVVPRLTPSAVNRMREQRRIEMENMQMLNRLHKVRPTSGMARNEQLKEFEKQATYGIPSGTMILSGEAARYETTPKRDLSSSMSSQRSRPSSAKSNVSLPGGRRSRPSSAKSNASVVSNASLRSNMSLRSNVSRRSTVSTRSNSRSDRDNRPSWDDRFSFS